jgi:methylated-DNA-protein-cysteine methyltransferase related protein
MPKSAAFIRIKKDVLTITKAIPAGKVTTYHSIGNYLYVVPRHIAYILTTLQDEEEHLVPWYRVVAKGGVISAPNSWRAQIQIEELKMEGIQFSDKKTIAHFEQVFIETDVFAEGLDVTRIPKSSNTSC